ncbi:hypothetical protein GCM10027087_53970 [Paractinoplanes abujensis]
MRGSSDRFLIVIRTVQVVVQSTAFTVYWKMPSRVTGRPATPVSAFAGPSPPRPYASDPPAPATATTTTAIHGQCRVLGARMPPTVGTAAAH